MPKQFNKAPPQPVEKISAGEFSSYLKGLLQHIATHPRMLIWMLTAALQWNKLFLQAS